MTLSEKIKLLFTSKSKLKARIEFLEDLVERYKANRDSANNYLRQLNLENDHLLRANKDNDQKIQHYRNLIDYICEVFGFTQYTLDNGDLGVAWDKGLIDEIIKARKNLNKKSKK